MVSVCYVIIRASNFAVWLTVALSSIDMSQHNSCNSSRVWKKTSLWYEDFIFVCFKSFIMLGNSLAYHYLKHVPARRDGINKKSLNSNLITALTCVAGRFSSFAEMKRKHTSGGGIHSLIHILIFLVCGSQRTMNEIKNFMLHYRM